MAAHEKFLGVALLLVTLLVVYGIDPGTVIGVVIVLLALVWAAYGDHGSRG